MSIVMMAIPVNFTKHSHELSPLRPPFSALLTPWNRFSDIPLST